MRRYFRADAAFAKPEVYEYLEQRHVLYAIRLPSNEVLQWEIAPTAEETGGRALRAFCGRETAFPVREGYSPTADLHGSERGGG